MSSELVGYGVTGATHYAVVYNAAAQVWNGSAFETFGTSAFTTYPVTMTEQTTSGRFVGSSPSASATRFAVRKRIGGSAAITDPVVWEEQLVVGANIAQILTVAPTLDANNVLNVSTKYIGGTLQTARDLGTSVLLSSGTGTGQLSLTSGKVTPIDVDGITHASAMELLMAVLSGVANPNGSTVTYMKRDGTTAKIAITQGTPAGKRTVSTIQS